MIGKIIKLGVTAIVVIGVVRGLMRYNNEQGGDGITDFVGAMIGGIADVTYRWLPPAIEFISDLLTSLAG